ncbi:hypothetical protein [Chitinolyticbacter albus]|uniref:hypothetical protein n=1 Tax=Chitinolyticbacter albus TaxID=2961951 RepID=UPI00210C857C|nr:hypothetical protein [Chitinolyticbacter albus]
MFRIATLVLAGFAATAQAQSDLACYESSANQRAYCLDRNEVRASGDVRVATLYTYAQKMTVPAGLSLLANCTSKKTGLLNDAGKDITAGREPSPVAVALAKSLCEVAQPKNDPTLPVF